MRNAETVLGVIRERGRRGLPLPGIYRQLLNPKLCLHASAKLARNRGAMTPGITAETVDGRCLANIQAIIARLRYERYRWTPVRRLSIAKKRSRKRRPLGLPTWSDTRLQDVIRSILEAYDEPQLSDHCHGFRPGRGCHTALTEIRRPWQGIVWFIEGDLAQCFDSLDHGVLLSILREKIQDNRFVRTIEQLLRAGDLEHWVYHAPLSGAPQGGVGTLPTKVQNLSSSSRRGCRVSRFDPARGLGVWAHLSRWCSLTPSQRSGSEEAVMARRAPHTTQALEGSVLVEPSRGSSAWVAQA
jgi:Reverse transcriptase (RNA-dependent DNA polymerase)